MQGKNCNTDQYRGKEDTKEGGELAVFLVAYRHHGCTGSFPPRDNRRCLCLENISEKPVERRYAST